MEKKYFVYILGSNRLTLYIGTTSNLVKRVYQHKNGFVEGFTKKYKIHKLLFYEIYDTPSEAIEGEKQMKNWHREWKLNLVKSINPGFRDLYPEILK